MMKKKTTKLLSAFLAMVTMMTMLPVSAMAAKVHDTNCNYEKDKTCECSYEFRRAWKNIENSLPDSSIDVDADDEDELIDWADDLLENVIRSNKKNFATLGVDTNKDLKVRVRGYHDDRGVVRIYYKDVVLCKISVNMDDDDELEWLDWEEDGETVSLHIVWKGIPEEERPKHLKAVLYKNGKDVDEQDIGYAVDNWRYKWKELNDNSSIIWGVDIPKVPEGMECEVVRVKGNYFKATITKSGTSGNSQSSPVQGSSPNQPITIPNGNKVNPSTGAF